MAVFLGYGAMPITDPIAARICDLFFENKQIIQDLGAAGEYSMSWAALIPFLQMPLYYQI